MLHCKIRQGAYLLRRNKTSGMMSKQLSVSAAFSVFALSALALFAPGSLHLSDAVIQTGATTSIAAPALTAKLPFVG